MVQEVRSLGVRVRVWVRVRVSSPVGVCIGPAVRSTLPLRVCVAERRLNLLGCEFQATRDQVGLTRAHLYVCMRLAQVIRVCMYV